MPLPPATEKPSSDLPKRLLTAAVMIPSVMWLIVSGGWPFLVGVMLFIGLGQHEFYKLIEGKGARPLVGLGLVTGLVIPVLAYFGNEYHTMLLVTVLLLMMMVAQLGKAQIHEALASISGTFFGVFYVSWLFSHAVLLRQIWQAGVASYGVEGAAALGLVPDSGIFMLLFAPVACIGCDAGALFVGRAWGKRKLAPQISPSKSVEGAVGGVIAGIAFSALLKLIFDFAWPALSAALPWALVVPFSMALGIVGMVGDLEESLLKRDAHVKDTGTLLPGIGGVLDRIDSPLLAIPLMYYMLLGYFWLSHGTQ